MSDLVLIEDRGPVRWIWLNRPEKRNAQSSALLLALEQAVQETAADRDVRVVVLAGKGPSFSSGHDLNEPVDNPAYAERASTVEGKMWQELDVYVRPVEALRALRVPTVCRVQGHCIAASVMLVSACDLVVAADDAVFTNNVTRDLGAADVEIPTLAWEMGARRAKQMLWCGESLDAATAQQAGLVNWVAPTAELDAKVEQVASDLLRVPREALALTKLSMQFAEDRRGRADANGYHFMAHQVSHATTEATTIREDRLAAIEARRAAKKG